MCHCVTCLAKWHKLLVECKPQKLTKARSEAAARYVVLSSSSCNGFMTPCDARFEFLTEWFTGLTAAAADVLSAMSAACMAVSGADAAQIIQIQVWKAKSGVN